MEATRRLSQALLRLSSRQLTCRHLTPSPPPSCSLSTSACGLNSSGSGKRRGGEWEGVLGIRREESSVWERRAPLSPNHVQSLVSKGIKVFLIVYSSPCTDWPVYKLVDTALEGAHLQLVSFVRSGPLSRAMKGSPQQVCLHCEIYLHVQISQLMMKCRLAWYYYTVNSPLQSFSLLAYLTVNTFLCGLFGNPVWVALWLKLH